MLSVVMIMTAFQAQAGTRNKEWKGKRIAILGDSISDPRRIGTQKCWWEYIAEDYKLTADSYAINGAQLSTFDQQAERVLTSNNSVAPYDAIFIFGGTNDFNASVPIGEFFNISKQTTSRNGKQTELLHREPVMGNDTFCARINKLLSFVKLHFPGVPVYILTPIHRGYATFSETNEQPDDSWANLQGLFVDSYVNALREACSIWSVKLIDLYSESGLLPAYMEYAPYFHKANKDRLHPNASGHRIIADTIESAISR